MEWNSERVDTLRRLNPGAQVTEIQAADLSRDSPVYQVN